MVKQGPTADDTGDPAGDEADLAAGLTGLSKLATGQLSLAEMLTHVAEFAVRAIPRADGAGLTLLQQGRGDTIVSSAPFVHEVDAIQYGIGEGPCITAATDGRTVVSGSLGGDTAFPRFGPRVSRLGVHSAVSLPLLGPDGPVGAMNVYSHARDAFDDRAVALGELFAVPAAIAVRNAHALAEARRLAAQLDQALRSRATIDQALGILMSRTGATPTEAFTRLREISQSENRKVAVVAQSVVEDAVRRARGRRGD